MIGAVEFHSWPAKGLGRAAIFLKEHDAGPYLETLSYACSHTLSYDTQCEAQRTQYLWRLIELSKRPPFFRDEVMRHLRVRLEDSADYDWPQLLGLARLYAIDGDAEMREAMYSTFDYLGFGYAGMASASVLVELDGIDGFIFAANRFEMANPDNELWEMAPLITDLESSLGKERASQLLAAAACLNQKVATILEAVRQHEQKVEEERAKFESRPVPDYLSLKAQPAESSWASELRRWAVTAKREQIKAAGDELLNDSDPEKICGFLRVLNRRLFSGSPDRLLILADDQRKRIRRAAVIALSTFVIQQYVAARAT